jgi:hypothetical protein
MFGCCPHCLEEYLTESIKEEVSPVVEKSKHTSYARAVTVKA